MKEDKEARAALWPVIKQVRKSGAKAYFVETKAYVNGREINCMT